MEKQQLLPFPLLAPPHGSMCPLVHVSLCPCADHCFLSADRGERGWSGQRSGADGHSERSEHLLRQVLDWTDRKTGHPAVQRHTQGEERQVQLPTAVKIPAARPLMHLTQPAAPPHLGIEVGGGELQDQSQNQERKSFTDDIQTLFLLQPSRQSDNTEDQN